MTRVFFFSLRVSINKLYQTVTDIFIGLVYPKQQDTSIIHLLITHKLYCCIFPTCAYIAHVWDTCNLTQIHVHNFVHETRIRIHKHANNTIYHDDNDNNDDYAIAQIVCLVVRYSILNSRITISFSEFLKYIFQDIWFIKYIA